MSSIGSVSQPRSTSSTSTTPSLEGLQRGSRGPDVMELQKQLNARGATLEVDGKFGPLTEAALKQFQASNGCSGNGRVDAGTVTALQTPPKATSPSTTPSTTTPTTPATTPTTPKPSAEVQQGARAKSAADEGRIRAQLGEVPTTTTKPEGLALTPAQVQTALANIETGKKQVAEEKAIVGQVKDALQREVGELEKPAAGATRTAADDAVLAGRKAQLEVATQAGGVLDLKTQGLDAAATALKDGVLTPDEAKHLVTIDGALQKGEAAIKTQAAAATSLVERGLKAGGRGSPTLGLKKPETPSTTTPATPPPSTTTPAGTTIAKADLDVATQRIQQAVAGARAEKEALVGAKATLEQEVKGLEGLKDRTVADDAVLAGRKAQLEVLGKANEHLDIRLGALDAATRALGDGVLTADEAKNLATIDTSLSTAQQQIAAQANLAAELVKRGRAAGGRGSDALL
jgi:peptidoglycan hydrolase-like protein with peptidoglycan-binding domain